MQEAKASILLVDDIPANLTALEAVLAPLGQRLVRATSGREALAWLLREDFACCLLDVQMPGLDGLETAKLIRARERTRYLPLLFITAFSSEEALVREGYARGAADYIVKPFDPDILRTKVAVFVDLYLQAHRLEQHRALLRDRERPVMERAVAAGRGNVEPQQQLDRALLDAAPVALGVLSPGMRLLRANAALARLWDLSEARAAGTGESEGEALRDVVPDLAPYLQVHAQHVLSTGRPLYGVPLAFELPRGSGRVQEVEASYFPLLEEDGRVRGVGLALRPQGEAAAARPEPLPEQASASVH
ncbi:MAG TPA: response regulator [Aggregicoccus sp.]|nr:response regulator [Aggregicoccus sp.]